MGIVHTVLVWLWLNTAGNIVASGITTTLGLWWHHRRLSAKHKAELAQVKAQHTEDLRKLRIHVLEAIGEVRDHLLGAISEQRQDGDR